jgi:hypothetical protein
MTRLPPTPLWPLPVLVGVVPVIAAHAAWLMSIAQGYVPDCNPYLDGCTSISRAARHGDANLLFQGLMLPCALLQFFHWYTMRDWLYRHHATRRAGRSLFALGVVAGASLAVYVTFLGTEGPVYDWLRRYGVIFYFASTFVAQLALLHRLEQMKPLHADLRRAMGGIGVAMLVLGLWNVSLPLYADKDTKDRLENAIEWNFALLMSAWFVVHAVLWKRTGFSLTFADAPPLADRERDTRAARESPEARRDRQGQ